VREVREVGPTSQSVPVSQLLARPISVHSPFGIMAMTSTNTSASEARRWLLCGAVWRPREGGVPIGSALSAHATRGSLVESGDRGADEGT
jgi:hypothetical protein